MGGGVGGRTVPAWRKKGGKGREEEEGGISAQQIPLASRTAL